MHQGRSSVSAPAAGDAQAGSAGTPWLVAVGVRTSCASSACWRGVGDVKKLESTDLSDSMKGCGSEKKVKGDSKIFILNEGLRPDARQRN
ncbi:unnamed protein product, partial [Rangifer tarandus platyrhynchus]